MKSLILLLTFSFVSAQTVEIKLPEFSKEVREQAEEKQAKSSEHCTVGEGADPGSNSLSCGSDKKEPTKKAALGELGGDNSQYARDKVRKSSKKSR